MRQATLPALLAALALASLPPLRGASPVWPVDPAAAAAELEAQSGAVRSPAPSTDIRGVLRFALEAVAAHGNPERVHDALLLARSMQDPDPASPTRGNFRWHLADRAADDPAAVEFAAELASLLRIAWAAELPEADRRLLDRILEDSLPALGRHRVTPYDSSLHLLRSWNLIAIGEALGRGPTAEEGYKHLDEWIRYTVLNGIAEFGTPAGYAIDLDALALIARYGTHKAGRQVAEIGINYIWTDLAANWWTAGQRPGGASSHGPGFMRGRADLAAHTWAAGWLGPKPPALQDDGWLPGPHEHQTAFLNACAWVPREEVTEQIRGHIPRTVVQRWCYTPLTMRTTLHVGRHVTIGAFGDCRADDDQTLVVNLGDSPAVAPLVLSMTARPDGPHLKPAIATVQRGADVLQMLSSPPPKAGSSLFRSSLTVPPEGEVWSADTPVKAGSDASPASLQPGLPVFIRVGDAVLGLRLVLALAVDGTPAPLTFSADPEPSTLRRITVTHGAPSGRGRATLVVWCRVAEGLDDAGFAAFRRAFSKALVSAELRDYQMVASVPGLKEQMRITFSIKSGRPIDMAGLEPDALLGVNGEDVGKAMLEDFGAQ